MNPRLRLLLPIAMALSITVALVAREVVHTLVVLPLSYVLWQFGILLDAVPELLWWAVLVVLSGLTIVWQLVPEIRTRSGEVAVLPREKGQVRTLALWLHRARNSAYFKWQVAHRLGRVSRRLADLRGSGLPEQPPRRSISDYIEAGTDGSFVDYAGRRPLVGRGLNTPLDIDPGEAVAYLESLLLGVRGRHAGSR